MGSSTPCLFVESMAVEGGAFSDVRLIQATDLNMRVRYLSINQHIGQKLGLQEFELNDLDRVVLLTGENGCGKSRLLSAVNWLLTQVARVGYDSLLEGRKQVARESQFLKCDDLDMDGVVLTAHMQDLEAQLAHVAPLNGVDLSFDADENQPDSLSLYVDLARFLDGRSSESSALNARMSIGVPRNIGDSLADPLAMSPLMYLEDACLRYSRQCDFDEVHVGFVTRDYEIQVRFNDLAKLVFDLASLRLSADADGTGRLNGIRLQECSLSDGQAQLVQWAVLIHANVLRDRGVPILFDEPELHLHPKALNRLFDILLERLPRSQLWIGTHSLSLVAHLSTQFPKSVWFGENGRFMRAGKHLPNLIEGLIGGDAGANELADFCGSIGSFAISSFAADCLMTPATVNYKAGDPQIMQAWSLLLKIPIRPLNILDFGAGHGRLLDGLAAVCSECSLGLAETISYWAIESNQANMTSCASRVEAHYGNERERVFRSAEAAIAACIEKAHVVVLANVLHEIPPNRWLADVFQSEALNKLLYADGWILIVEDTVLPRGELAHKYGFVVLESEALQRLVGASDAENIEDGFFTSTIPRYGARLQATLIHKRWLRNITAESVCAALATQKDRALLTISNLRRRTENATYEDGRRHAYLTQLVTNTILAIESLSE